jgi:integrase
MALQGLAVSTQDGRLAAIRDRHLDAGYRSPTSDDRFRRVRDGVRRTHGVRAEGKDAISLQLLIAMLAIREPGPPPPAGAPVTEQVAWRTALRDRCLLLLGYFAGPRRSELAGLPVDHLHLVEQGLRVLIGRSKRDQEGQGRLIDLPYAPPELAFLCPVRATLAWLDATGRREHLYRSGQPRTGQVPLLSGLTRGAAVRSTALSATAVVDIIKSTAAAAGQPAEIVENLAGHSLRAGFATAAETAGVQREIISRVLGHSTGVTGRYVRHGFDGVAQRAIYALAATTIHAPTPIDTTPND